MPDSPNCFLPPYAPSSSSNTSLSSSFFPLPSILSYNIRGLSFYSTSSRALHRRISISKAFNDFIKNHDIICVQETHLARNECFAFSSLNGCLISRNNSDSQSAGTVIIDTPNILKFYSPSDVTLPSIAGGFVQLRRYTPLSNSRKPFQLFNVYFNSKRGDFSFNSQLISAISTADNSIDTFVCGDFNFIENPNDSTSLSPLFPPSSFIDLFSSFKTKFNLFEPPHDNHTFYHITDDPVSPFSWSSRIDRILLPVALLDNPIISPSISIPFHYTNLKISNRNNESSFSDHLPIHICYVDSSSHSSDSNSSIPIWLASSPEFVSVLRDIWSTPSTYNNSYNLFAKFKKALFKAAKITKRKKLSSFSAPLLLSHHIALLRHINSPLQDFSRIFFLLSVCPVLSSLVSFSENRWYDNGLLSAIHNLQNSVSTSFSNPPSINPIKLLAEKAPSSRVRVGNLRVNLDSPEMISNIDRANLAADYWSKIWASRSNKPASSRSAFLTGYSKKVDSTLCHNVKLDDIIFSIKHSNNSSSGPDGIPFAAWRAAPDLAAPILLAVFRAICSGQLPPPGFNKGLLYLIPKKNTGLISDTRPISVTNCDNRILSATVARAIMPATLELVDPAQKGFLNGRSGADHVTDINKFFYEGVEKNIDRYLFLLDTAKAFDSIDHEWILHIVKRVCFPEWFIRFVKGMLNSVRVAPCFGRSTPVWIDIERGVKQGCPLSPLLFILAYDPLLFSLSRVPNINYFAFADDLAITTNSIISIYPALSIIDSFSIVSGLGINRDKSFVLTTSPPSSHSLIRSGLAASPWPDLPLKEKGTHLGIVIGREVTLDEIWSTPLAKAISKLRSSHAFIKSLSLSNRILFINVFIISLFSYVGLFYVLPTGIWNVVRSAISKCIIPFNGGAFSYGSLICGKTLFNIKPLKDVWAYVVSLLAVRSSFISSSFNYFDLPSVNLTYTKIISRHRDAAAIDFWRSRHLPDGTLIPLSDLSSAEIYKIIIHDVYYEDTAIHCGGKFAKYIAPSSSLISPFDFVSSISSRLHASRAPNFLLLHHFSLINNALPTSRRLRHLSHTTVDNVALCFFCGRGQDSISHIYGDCVVISNARFVFFKKFDLDLSPFFLFSLVPSPSASSVSPSFPRAHAYPRLVNFLSSLIQRPSPFPPTPLAPGTLGASLGPTFLYDIPDTLVRPILAFNYAVWHYRKPALASAPVQGHDWIVSRIVELATGYLSCFKSKSKKRVRSINPGEEPSIISHNVLINSTDKNVLFCYTDGSATPNPGPSGAGVSIFVQDPDEVVDAGVSLGLSTNNVAELVALLLCFFELIRIFERRHFTGAFVFCDSSYAIRQATSSKTPVLNRALIKLVRAAHSKAIAAFNVKLVWLKGHSVAGGNKRVDRLSNLFASSNVPNAAPFDLAFLTSYSSSTRNWQFGFPLASVSFNSFASLPGFPWPRFSVPAFADALLPKEPVSVNTRVSRSSARLKTLREKPILQNVRQSKKLTISPTCSVQSSFYDTESEPLDSKHTDDDSCVHPSSIDGSCPDVTLSVVVDEHLSRKRRPPILVSELRRSKRVAAFDFVR